MALAEAQRAELSQITVTSTGKNIHAHPRRQVTRCIDFGPAKDGFRDPGILGMRADDRPAC